MCSTHDASSNLEHAYLLKQTTHMFVDAILQVGYRPDEDRGILDFGLTGHIQGSNYLRASTAVVDCGVRDLKGIARPEHVYQVTEMKPEVFRRLLLSCFEPTEWKR